MNIIFAAALAATATIATPALADPVAPAASPTAAAELGTAHGGKRYCLVTPAITGSIINRKTCHTRAEWMKEGVDPLDYRR